MLDCISFESMRRRGNKGKDSRQRKKGRRVGLERGFRREETHIEIVVAEAEPPEAEAPVVAVAATVFEDMAQKRERREGGGRRCWANDKELDRKVQGSSLSPRVCIFCLIFFGEELGQGRRYEGRRGGQS